MQRIVKEKWLVESVTYCQKESEEREVGKAFAMGNNDILNKIWEKNAQQASIILYKEMPLSWLLQPDPLI